MKFNFDIGRMMDFMMEADAATFDYCKSSKVYFKKHGHGVYLDKASTPEEKHIDYDYHEDQRTNDIVWSIIECLGFDQDQRRRLMSAEKALKRWYEKETKWQRLPPENLLERIGKFVLG